jgi:predicted outer membrane lipoprotein
VNAETVFYSTDYIEYLITGVHSLAWATALIVWLLGQPLAVIFSINPLWLVALLPFA